MSDLKLANKCFRVATRYVDEVRKEAPDGAIIAFWNGKAVVVHASKALAKAEEFQDRLQTEEKSTSVLLPLPKDCVHML